MIRIFLYLGSIVLSNVITAAFMPLQVGVFLIPMGTFFIGATFIFRDLVQNKYGRPRAYLIISIALVLSALVSALLGDTLMIVAASAVSFIIAETADTEIYTRMKLTLPWRVFYSGSVGGVLDSTIFVVVGLSPIGAGFVSWSAVPYAIIGQILAKTFVQMIGALILSRIYAVEEKKMVPSQM